MFSSVKVPRNLCQYRLFRGAADFGNLQQWDLYEKGYSFLTVVSVPKFIQRIADGTNLSGNAAAMQGITKRLLNNFVYILEHEFRGLTGIPSLSADAATITDGISELQMINKVTEDTSVQIQMSFFEKSGRPITKFAELFLRGIKDTRTQGKTYWGLIDSGAMEPGYENEVFSLLYYVTDNTYRNLEGAYLFMCAQITEVPLADIFETQKGTYENPEISLTFNCFPVTGDDVNKEAARMLEYLASEDAGMDRLIVDTQSVSGFYKGVKDLQENGAYGLRISGKSNDDAHSYLEGSKSAAKAYQDDAYQNAVTKKSSGKGVYSITRS